LEGHGHVRARRPQRGGALLLMNRRRTSRVGADRWLVSYADFTTLLLAFFMALYAASDINPAKLASAESSLRAAFKTAEAAAEPAVGSRPVVEHPAARPAAGSLPAPRTE